jgi:hypothetical protein
VQQTRRKANRKGPFVGQGALVLLRLRAPNATMVEAWAGWVLTAGNQSQSDPISQDAWATHVHIPIAHHAERQGDEGRRQQCEGALKRGTTAPSPASGQQGWHPQQLGSHPTEKTHRNCWHNTELTEASTCAACAAPVVHARTARHVRYYTFPLPVAPRPTALPKRDHALLTASSRPYPCASTGWRSSC